MESNSSSDSRWSQLRLSYIAILTCVAHESQDASSIAQLASDSCRNRISKMEDRVQSFSRSDVNYRLFSSWIRTSILAIRSRIDSDANCVIELTDWLLRFLVCNSGARDSNTYWDASARDSLIRLLPSLSNLHLFSLRSLTDFICVMQDLDVVTVTVMTILLTIVASIREEPYYLPTIFYLFKVHLESFSSVLFGNLLMHGLMILEESLYVSCERASPFNSSSARVLVVSAKTIDFEEDSLLMDRGISSTDLFFSGVRFLEIYARIIESVVDEPALMSTILADISRNVTPEKNKSVEGIRKLSFLATFVAALLFLERFDQALDVLKSISMADFDLNDPFLYKVLDLIHLSLLSLSESNIGGSVSKIVANLKPWLEQLKRVSRQQRGDFAKSESKLLELLKLNEEKDLNDSVRPTKIPRIVNTQLTCVNVVTKNDWESIHDHSSTSYEISHLIQAVLNINPGDLSQIVALHAINKLAWEGGCKGETANAFLASRINKNQLIIPISDLLYTFMSEKIANRIDSSSPVHRRFTMLLLGIIVAESDATRASHCYDANLLKLRIFKNSCDDEEKSDHDEYAMHRHEINLLRIELSLQYPILRENLILSTLFTVHLASHWVNISHSPHCLKIPIECENFLNEIIFFVSIPLLVSYWDWLSCAFVQSCVTRSRNSESDKEKICKNMLAVLYISINQSPISFVEFAKEALSAEKLLQLTPCFIDCDSCNFWACNVLRAINCTFINSCHSIMEFQSSRRELLIRHIHIFQSFVWFLRHFEPALLGEDKLISNRECYKSDISGGSDNILGIYSVVITNKRIAKVCQVSEHAELCPGYRESNEQETKCINHLAKFSDDVEINVDPDCCKVIYIPDAFMLFKASLNMNFYSVDSLNHYSKVVRSISSDIYKYIRAASKENFCSIQHEFSFEAALVEALISFCEDCDWKMPPSACKVLCLVFDAFYEPCDSNAAFRDESICGKLIDHFLPALRNAYSIHHGSAFPNDKFLTLMLRSLAVYFRFQERTDERVYLPALCEDIIGEYPDQVHSLLESAYCRLSASCSNLVNSIIRSGRLRKSSRNSALDRHTSTALSAHSLSSAEDSLPQRSGSELLPLEPRSPQPFKVTGGTPRIDAFPRYLATGSPESTSEYCVVDGPALVPAPVEHVICTSVYTLSEYGRYSDSKTAPSLAIHNSSAAPVSSEVLSDIDLGALSKKFSVPFAKIRK